MVERYFKLYIKKKIQGNCNILKLYINGKTFLVLIDIYILYNNV